MVLLRLTPKKRTAREVFLEAAGDAPIAHSLFRSMPRDPVPILRATMEPDLHPPNQVDGSCFQIQVILGRFYVIQSLYKEVFPWMLQRGVQSESNKPRDVLHN